ncbi:hypothetical protein [Xenorhabdus bharatensis]|uniref:hypothetical protein n=1 Tax=Xenorhabdus bharatensis TaxID=3136256 RepID=UPI0030F3DBB3
MQELKALTKTRILDLCLEMVENWGDIPGITERREFALALLDEGKPITDTADSEPEPEPEPEVDYAAQFTQAEEHILRLAKGGYRNEAVAILRKFGGAIKLGQVPKENLAEVIQLAQAAWEG